MRVAVFGCGSIGLRFVRLLRELGVGEVVAYDPQPAARAAASEWAARTCGSVDEALALRPDAVLVATPPSAHVPLALEAVRSGAAVFVEKPLSHTHDGVAELEREAAARRATVMVACNMRFHPGPALVKRLLGEGVVGRPVAARIETGSYLPAWRPGRDHRDGYSADAAAGGGALLDCIHEIDLALWLFGPAALAGAATVSGDAIGVRGEALAELLLRHDDGVLASVHLNFLQRDYHRACRVVGTEGTVRWSFGARAVTVWRNGADERYPEPEGWTVDEMYRDELRHFLACAAAGAAPCCTLADGRAALDIALAARTAGAPAESGDARTPPGHFRSPPTLGVAYAVGR